MKVGVLTRPNKKGQIVIPKSMRDSLGIDEHVMLNLMLSSGGIYLYPVEQVVTRFEGEGSYLKVLEKTKGSWGKEDIAMDKKRSRLELKASSKRKSAW